MKNSTRTPKLFKGLKMMLGLAALGLVILTTSCGDDDGGGGGSVSGDDIVTIASGSDDLNSLVAALGRFPDLVSTLSDENGTFTVFAPTDGAFTALLDATGQTSLDDLPDNVLRRVLEYHVVADAELLSTTLTDGATATTVLGEAVSVGVDGSDVTINGANVTTADIEATNGIIHIIDGILVPSLEASILNTVVEPAYFNNQFTVLTEAVVTAGLLETLIDTDEEYTVFAPTNDAFEAAGITSLDGLTANDLSPILLYHVLGEEVLAADLPETGSAIESLNGDFYLSINTNGVYINGLTQVTATDITQDNGVVHVIDRTLIPASDDVVELAVAASTGDNPEFTQLVAALTAVENDPEVANLITVLSGDGPFTVFAPTDAGFQALYDLVGDIDEDEDNDINDLVAAAGLDVIATVLQYHVVADRVFSTDIPNLLGEETSVSIGAVAGGNWTLNSNLTITDVDGALELGSVDATIVGTDLLGTNGVIHTIDQVILP